MSIPKFSEMLKMGSKLPEYERWEVRNDTIEKMIGYQGIQQDEIKMVEAEVKKPYWLE